MPLKIQTLPEAKQRAAPKAKGEEPARHRNRDSVAQAREHSGSAEGHRIRIFMAVFSDVSNSGLRT